jgi:predicted thioesterase
MVFLLAAQQDITTDFVSEHCQRVPLGLKVTIATKFASIDAKEESASAA